MIKRRVLPVLMAAQLPRVVLVDANVFFSPRLRDFVMGPYDEALINVHWTKAIEKEWIRNVVAKHGVDPQSIQDCLFSMRETIDGWEVSGFAKYSKHFENVDAKDRHVAAAAYKLSLEDWPGQPVALITQNGRDFPVQAFEGTQVLPYSFADYLDALYAEAPDEVLRVAENCRRKLKHPPLDKEAYVATLVKHRCLSLAHALADKWSVESPEIAADGSLYYASEVKQSRVSGGRTRGGLR